MKTVYDLFPDIDKSRLPQNYADIQDPFFWQTFKKCKPYSMLSIEAFYNLFRSMEYIARQDVPGDIVECGVFLGGAILAMSDFAQHFNLRGRSFFLYDTFAGFPGDDLSEIDVWGNKVPFTRHEDFLEIVRRVVALSTYPADKFQLIRGPVEKTLRPNNGWYDKLKGKLSDPARESGQHPIPEKIALLRLDTDYYESTRVELNELYPRLSVGGVLIVDDYGMFQGARRATDEYFEQQKAKILLSRLNFTVRTGVKLG